MMRVAITNLRNDFAGTALRYRQRAGQIAEQSAKRTATDASKRAPRDTGHLQDDSIHAVKLSAYTWEVQVETADADHEEYGHFVEYGTSKMAAQPFLTPAVEAERSRFDADVRALARGAF